MRGRGAWRPGAGQAAADSDRPDRPRAPCRPRHKRPPAGGRDLYAPPSFTALVNDATASLAAALEDGRKLVEVEFPALPGDKDGERRETGSGERERERRRGCARGSALSPTPGRAGERSTGYDPPGKCETRA